MAGVAPPDNHGPDYPCTDTECPVCYPEDEDEMDAFNEEVARFEPDGSQAPPIVDTGAHPIETMRANPAAVEHLQMAFYTAVEHVMERRAEVHRVPVTDADVLATLMNCLSAFAGHTVLEKRDTNPTIAFVNAVAIKTVLLRLIDDINGWNIPTPAQVN